MKQDRKRANESISKYKLLSAYGGPGSIVHTQYGSIIISCIEEWGFLNRILDIHQEKIDMQTPLENMKKVVSDEAGLERNGNIGISNDNRLLDSLKLQKKLPNLKYLVLVPDIELKTTNNKIENGGVEIAIPSTYMPKLFRNANNKYKSYNEWYKEWTKRQDNNGNKRDQYGENFHPPKYETNIERGWTSDLKQDNLILLCEHGHISDFPWSKFLRWRKDEPSAIYEATPTKIFEGADCCNKPEIRIASNSGNASGFDGKWLKCLNCNKGVSLKGLMGVKLKCPGHKPWEASTGETKYYSGDSRARIQDPPHENCSCINPMKVALTTGNNIYYSRIKSSIYLHSELFESDESLEIMRLEEELSKAIQVSDFEKCIKIRSDIENISENMSQEEEDIPDTKREILYRYNEFKAFHRAEDLLKKYPKDLNVKEVTNNLDGVTSKYFKRVLRVDNLKITSAQLDFSRVVPLDADADNAHPKNIFRNNNENVLAYPVVESFGEGIFFSFNEELIAEFIINNNLIGKMQLQLAKLEQGANQLNKGAINFANVMNSQLYLVHTFSHLIMRELEFRCGYPTASLSERIYVSNEEEYKMYGCLIYTAEGAEGSMGGLIAQTREKNLNNLIKSAIKRSTICNSDPLCWESEGQGLFDLNFASCFSCSLLSETSCEHRNLYLDRKILVDKNEGFFKDLI